MLPETLRAKKNIKSTMGQPTAAGTAPDSPADTGRGAAAGENTAPITPERDDGAVVDVATTGPGLKLQWVRRRASLEGCKLTLDSLDALDLEGARCTPRGDGGLRMYALKPDGKTRINDGKWAELQAGLKEKLARTTNKGIKREGGDVQNLRRQKAKVDQTRELRESNLLILLPITASRAGLNLHALLRRARAALLLSQRLALVRGGAPLQPVARGIQHGAVGERERGE